MEIALPKCVHFDVSRSKGVHRGHERRELLHDGVIRGRHALVPERSWSSAGAVARNARSTSRTHCLPLPAATATGCRRAATACGPASACAALPCVRGGLVPPLRLLASRRSKETPKTGDHGGRVRQPKRHCLLLTDAGIPHLLEDGYRALRAPAASSMPSASPETPGPRAADHCG